MDREIWSWILNKLSNEQLIFISQQLKIKIPGFRESNYKKNLGVIKDKLIQQAINKKNILKIGSVCNQLVNENTKWLMFREKGVDFLFEYILMEKNLILPVFLSLLSSPNSEQYLTAVTLFDKLKEVNQLTELENIDSDNDNNNQNNILKEKIRDLELNIKEKNKEIANKEKKVILLQEQQIRQKQLLDAIQKEMIEIKHLLEKNSNEITEKDEEIKRKQESIFSLNEKTRYLEEELESTKSIISFYEEQAASLVSKCSDINQYDSTMLLIGNKPNMKVMNKFESVGYKVNICNDLESINSYINCNRIWLIEYQVPSRLKREIQKLPCFKNITIIQDHNELLTMIDKLIKGEI